MKKYGKIALIAIASLVGILLLAVIGFNVYLHIRFCAFYTVAEVHGEVPGISDGFIQQGISHAAEEDLFLSCGYMKNGEASRIYLFRPSDRKSRFVTLAESDGEDNTAHAGGLCLWQEKVFLTDDDRISVFSLEEILDAAENSGKVLPIASFSSGFAAAFCYAREDILYVGEFYREQNYQTDPSHHFLTPSGEEHHAIVAAFSLTALQEADFTEAEPLFALSVPDLVQGMCFTDSGRICLSSSYALAPSKLSFYAPDYAPSSVTISLCGKTDVPVYFLDSACLDETHFLPPMAEELVNVNGRIYIMNESASAKYIFGKFTGGAKLYSLAVS